MFSLLQTLSLSLLYIPLTHFKQPDFCDVAFESLSLGHPEPSSHCITFAEYTASPGKNSSFFDFFFRCVQSIPEHEVAPMGNNLACQWDSSAGRLCTKEDRSCQAMLPLARNPVPFGNYRKLTCFNHTSLASEDADSFTSSSIFLYVVVLAAIIFYLLHLLKNKVGIRDREAQQRGTTRPQSTKVLKNGTAYRVRRVVHSTGKYVSS